MGVCVCVWGGGGGGEGGGERDKMTQKIRVSVLQGTHLSSTGLSEDLLMYVIPSTRLSTNVTLVPRYHIIQAFSDILLSEF